jgi:3-dehydroquinate synthase
MPLEVLKTLPSREWKSGMAELIKTVVLDSAETLDLVKSKKTSFLDGAVAREPGPYIKELIERAVLVKGRIVEADPRETGIERALLNLGHSFGHALESATGLGTLSHGEAVAWGVIRACELGQALGITPPARAQEIRDIIAAYGYETGAPHSLLKETGTFMKVLGGDKKKKAGKLSFVVPDAERAVLISADIIAPKLLEQIINGDLQQ